MKTPTTKKPITSRLACLSAVLLSGTILVVTANSAQARSHHGHSDWSSHAAGGHVMNTFHIHGNGNGNMWRHTNNGNLSNLNTINLIKATHGHGSSMGGMQANKHSGYGYKHNGHGHKNSGHGPTDGPVPVQSGGKGGSANKPPMTGGKGGFGKPIHANPIIANPNPPSKTVTVIDHRNGTVIDHRGQNSNTGIGKLPPAKPRPVNPPAMTKGPMPGQSGGKGGSADTTKPCPGCLKTVTKDNGDGDRHNGHGHHGHGHHGHGHKHHGHDDSGDGRTGIGKLPPANPPSRTPGPVLGGVDTTKPVVGMMPVGNTPITGGNGGIGGTGGTGGNGGTGGAGGGTGTGGKGGTGGTGGSGDGPPVNRN